MSTTGSAAPEPADEAPQPRVPFPEEITDDDLARHFALSEDDRGAVRRCRGDHNRIGFALQLCFIRWRGRFVTSFEAVPDVTVQHVAGQLEVAVSGRFSYPDRERTRREHNEAIREHLNLRIWQGSDAEMLSDELVRRALDKRLPERDMLPAAERILMERRIVLPGESVLRPVARRALGQVEAVAVEHKVRLWKLDRSLTTEHLDPLFDGAVKVEVIKKQWDNIRRLVASLRDRVAPAHILGRCLSASISHDPLAQAVDELGKVHASIYYVQVLGSPELRSASRHGQARHESQNQLGRAIVIGAKGEIRAPDQDVAAATLFAHTLVQTKILYYNTCHYAELLPELERDGFDVRPEILAEVSPLLYRHINFRGTYDFMLSDDEGAL